MDRNDEDNVPRNAIVGSHSTEGIPRYVVFAMDASGKYFAGSYEKGNGYAEYVKVDNWEVRSSRTWQYLVIKGE